MAEEKDVTEKQDPRETPAFKGVLKQLEEERREKADMAARLAALTDEAEKRRSKEERSALEQKGKYEEAIAAYQRESEAQIAKAQAEAAKLKQDYERATIERELVGAGVAGKPVAFLATDYLALAERPPIQEWIEQAKSHPDFSMFFSRPRSPQPGDQGGRAAATSGSVSWEQVKAGLSSPDPAVRRNSDLAVRKHMEDHGKLPW